MVGVWRDGRSILIPNALGQLLTPSVVSLDADGQFSVGAVARERLATQPRQTAAAFKRYMGTSRALNLGDREFRPEELSAFVLRSLKADAEVWLGQPVDEAIITVPAYFSDAQRQATRAAGELAGLKVARLLNEPTAAALAYGLQERTDSQILVADLGGGTFDVSLLEMNDGLMEVRATAGDNFLGGEDFVDVLIAAFMAGIGDDAGLPPIAIEAPVHSAVRQAAERTKRALSTQDTAIMEVLFDGREIKWQITRDEFAELAAPLLARIRQPIERALRDAQIHPDSLTHTRKELCSA